MMNRVLIIGCGSMGSAVLSGCLKAGVWKKEQITIKDRDPQNAKNKAESYGVSWTDTIDQGLQNFDFILLSVKPNIVPSVLECIGRSNFHGLLVSLAAAVTLQQLEENISSDIGVIRVMPNTPVSVGAGMTAVALGSHATEQMGQDAERVFSALGRTAVVTERQLDELGALSGAGPGYAFVIIDALADGGVRIGLPRALAIEAAAQTLYGAAKMVLDTGRHPAELRDQVTSPGGTTIAGIHAMEQRGIRAALMDGIAACMERSDEMGRKK